VVRARKIPLPHLRLLVAAGARARAASNVLFDRRPRFSRCRWSRSRRGRIRCLGPLWCQEPGISARPYANCFAVSLGLRLELAASTGRTWVEEVWFGLNSGEICKVRNPNSHRVWSKRVFFFERSKHEYNLDD
jgi:hypothetical protein